MFLLNLWRTEILNEFSFFFSRFLLFRISLLSWWPIWRLYWLFYQPYAQQLLLMRNFVKQIYLVHQKKSFVFIILPAILAKVSTKTFIILLSYSNSIKIISIPQINQFFFHFTLISSFKFTLNKKTKTKTILRIWNSIIYFFFIHEKYFKRKKKTIKKKITGKYSK